MAILPSGVWQGHLQTAAKQLDPKQLDRHDMSYNRIVVVKYP